MEYINWLKLEYEAKKRGIKIGQFAKLIEMNESTYYRKRRRGIDVTLGQLKRIVEVLKLTEAETKEIFMKDWQFGKEAATAADEITE